MQNFDAHCNPARVVTIAKEIQYNGYINFQFVYYTYMKEHLLCEHKAIMYMYTVHNMKFQNSIKKLSTDNASVLSHKEWPYNNRIK